MCTWRRVGAGRGKTTWPWDHGQVARPRPSKRQKLRNVKKRNVKYAKVENFTAKKGRIFRFNLHNRYNYSNYSNQNLTIKSTSRRATFYSFSIFNIRCGISGKNIYLEYGLFFAVQFYLTFSHLTLGVFYVGFFDVWSSGPWTLCRSTYSLSTLAISTFSCLVFSRSTVCLEGESNFTVHS